MDLKSVFATTFCHRSRRGSRPVAYVWDIILPIINYDMNRCVVGNLIRGSNSRYAFKLRLPKRSEYRHISFDKAVLMGSILWQPEVISSEKVRNAMRFPFTYTRQITRFDLRRMAILLIAPPNPSRAPTSSSRLDYRVRS